MTYIPGASKPPVPLPEVAMAQQAEVAREFARQHEAREAREAEQHGRARPWWKRLFSRKSIVQSEDRDGRDARAG